MGSSYKGQSSGRRQLNSSAFSPVETAELRTGEKEQGVILLPFPSWTPQVACSEPAFSPAAEEGRRMFLLCTAGSKFRETGGLQVRSHVCRGGRGNGEEEACTLEKNDGVPGVHAEIPN